MFRLQTKLCLWIADPLLQDAMGQAVSCLKPQNPKGRKSSRRNGLPLGLSLKGEQCSLLAEISIQSPRNLIIFIIFYFFWDQSLQNMSHIILKTETLKVRQIRSIVICSLTSWYTGQCTLKINWFHYLYNSYSKCIPIIFYSILKPKPIVSRG